MITVDVSFISLDRILAKLLELMTPETILILLFKPQFEVGKANLRKAGVPKNAKVVSEALDRFVRF